MHQAASYDKIRIVDLLIKRGLTVNAREFVSDYNQLFTCNVTALTKQTLTINAVSQSPHKCIHVIRSASMKKQSVRAYNSHVNVN